MWQQGASLCSSAVVQYVRLCLCITSLSMCGACCMCICVYVYVLCVLRTFCLECMCVPLLSLQALPPDGQLVSVEKDISWWLVAKRFMWQASQGQKNQQRDAPLGRKVGGWMMATWGRLIRSRLCDDYRHCLHGCVGGWVGSLPTLTGRNLQMHFGPSLPLASVLCCAVLCPMLCCAVLCRPSPLSPPHTHTHTYTHCRLTCG